MLFLRKFLSILLAAILMTSLILTMAVPAMAVVKTTIVLDRKGTVTLNLGETLQLTATVTPAATVTWKSSKKSVATVSGGLVKPRKEGKVVITAKAGGKTAKVTVKVVDPNKPTAITINQGKKKTLAVGDQLQLTMTPTPATASSDCVFKSSKSSVASVNKSTGVVTAKKPGTAKITVTSKKNKKAKATITIKVEKAATPVDKNDLSSWLGKKMSAAQSALGLNPQVESQSGSTIVYKLSGTGFYMNAKGTSPSDATISYIALQGQGKSDFNICGFNTKTMTYSQAKSKAKAGKWTIQADDDLGNFRIMVLIKSGKWLRVDSSRSGTVTSVRYANSN